MNESILFNDVPVCEYNYDNANNVIYWFGQAPSDPTKIITEESKFLLIPTLNASENARNIVAKRKRMNGETLMFLFERKEGDRKFQYWSKAITNDELIAAKNFFSFDENLMRVVEPNQELPLSHQQRAVGYLLSQELGIPQ